MFGSFDIAPITAGLGVQILVLRVEPFLDYCFFGFVFYKRDSLVTMPIGGTLSQKVQLSPCVLLVSEQSSGLLEDAEHQVLLDPGLCNPSSAFEIVNLKWRRGGVVACDVAEFGTSHHLCVADKEYTQGLHAAGFKNWFSLEWSTCYGAVALQAKLRTIAHHLKFINAVE